MKRRQLNGVGVLLSVVGALVMSSGCGQSEEGASFPGDNVVASTGASGSANRTGVPITGSPSVAADDKNKDEQGEGEEDDKPKDYWADITFDRTNFEEVRQQVKKRYIDPHIDETWAYAQAASFAVGSSEDNFKILLPEAFYKARKANPDEKGGLDGKVTKLAPGDAFVILDEAPDKEEDKEKEPRKRLSDEEIRELRDKQKARSALLHKTWAAIDFGAKDFDRVVGWIEKNYKKSEKWTVKKIWVSAAQGYLYGLDPHSSLVPRTAWDDSVKKTTDDSFDGIGAILTKRPNTDYTIVESPIQGQPAVRAGLRAGDVIQAVDGKDIKGESLSKVVSRIRGPRGSEVVLTVEREGEPKPVKVAIIRSHIAIKNIQGRLLDNHEDVGYVKITGFVRTTDRDLGEMLSSLTAKTKSGRLRGLVLDMRNNSGGLLNQGIRVADRFLAGGPIVSVKSRNARENEVYPANAEGETSLPIVVIVNDGTASAAEIVASALQDNRRALVVGDRTFGKASVQTLFSPMLQDDYFIKMTVARYYSPSGRTLQVVGVLPDIKVTPERGKKMPLGFREENLSGHLRALDAEYVSAMAGAANRAQKCADKSGITKRLFEADPNPAIKFDHQLMVAGDLLECSIAESIAKRGK